MKRLIICADGTWNTQDQVDDKTKKRRPTNVTKIARAIIPRTPQGVDQVVIYHEGIGTGGAMDQFSGGAFGSGMENNIRQLYRSIVYNYVPGDELFFFGFSRGAFTVRTLAGFMKWVGLIEKDDDFWVPEIYGCYEKGKRPGSPEWTAAFQKVQGTRPCPPIKCIGVFDTVGALGAPGILGQLFNKNKYAYHDIGLHPEIEYAYHALAIDEKRKPFTPSIWEKPAGWNGTLEQAWFAGAHSNVGGGYAPDGLANEALHWIVEKTEKLGLVYDSKYLGFFKPCFNSLLVDSMTAKFKLLGTYDRQIGKLGEVLHQEALDRRALGQMNYHPKNLETYIQAAGTTTKCSTTRIARGTPC